MQPWLGRPSPFCAWTFHTFIYTHTRTYTHPHYVTCAKNAITGINRDLNTHIAKVKYNDVTQLGGESYSYIPSAKHRRHTTIRNVHNDDVCAPRPAPVFYHTEPTLFQHLALSRPYCASGAPLISTYTATTH